MTHETASDIADRAFDTIAWCIRRHARQRPDAPALSVGEVTLSYAALDERMDRVAAARQRDGVAPGEAIALCAAPSVAAGGRFPRRAARREGAFGIDATRAEALVRGYAAAIGDVEQTLAGEDYALDALLRRGAPAAEAQPAAVARPKASAKMASEAE